MKRTGKKLDINCKNESVETLLLMAVLGQEEGARRAALTELKRRGAMAFCTEDEEDVFMTNLSGIC